jgi:hypothetical protein
MKLNLLSKTKSSTLSFAFSTFICAILLLFFGNANAQTTVQTTLSAPTADSYGPQWVAGTAYKVNDLVYHTDNTGTSPVIRVWKVTTAGTSSTAGPTGTADFGILTGLAITGTGGQFSCTSSTWLIVGNTITITGTIAGTGSITGYATGKVYTISATNGSTTFTLTDNGNPITTTAGTPTGLTYSGVGIVYAYLGTVTLATSTWVCPTGVTSIDVELWGGGGAGGSASSASAASGTRLAGGGGAGSYVKKILAVVPGTTYNVTVGGGGYAGGTSQASGYFGLFGGKSQFSGSGITTLTASGGTGGSGSGSYNPKTAPGGVLGGVYGYNITGTKTVDYRKTITTSLISINGTAGQFSTTMAGMDLKIGSVIYISGTITGTGSIAGYATAGKSYYVIDAANAATSTFTISETLGGNAVTTVAGSLTGATIYNFPFGTITGGGGSGAIVTAPNNGTSIGYVGAISQGTDYTSNPTVTYNIGSGQVVEAYFNPNINSAGDIVLLGANGGDCTTTTSGAGGANAQGAAGGAAGTPGTATGGFPGTPGAAVGSGGGGGISYSTGTGTFASAKGGTGANGQIIITYTAPITTYTYTGSGDLHNVANWKDGTNSPADFITDFQIFKINSNATTTAAWTVSGAASKVVVGDSSTTNVSLTIASGFGITGTLDVTNGNKVYVQDVAILTAEVLTGGVVTTPATYTMGFPTFGDLGATSEVHYQNSTVNNALIKNAFSYGKLYVDGTGTGNVFFSGLGTTNHIVKTLFEVAENNTVQFSDVSTYYMSLNSGASAVINGTVKVGKAVGFVSSNVGTAGATLCALQFIGAEVLTLGANSTIEYNRADSNTTQIVTPRTDYKNLILSGANNSKSFTGTTVSGNLTVNITGVTGTTPIPATSTLAANVTVNGALNFTAGKITTATNALTLGTSGTISGAGATTGWVVGNLIKQTATNASPSFNFAIGDATNYTPISVTFTGVNASATGSITASTKTGDHPQIASSDLDATKSVNRTWNLLNNGVSGYTDYSVTLNYAAADNDAAATPASFVIRKYEGTTWTSPTTTPTPSATSASATGLVDFGDFAVGEINALSTINFELDSIKIVPNPSTSNFVTITSSLNEDIEVVVFDVIGKQISSQKLYNNRLDVSELKSGMYLLKISQKEKTTTKKLIVK